MKIVDVRVMAGGARGKKAAGVYYCGRATAGWSGGPLQNPFVIGRDGSREEVIQLFRKWLWDQLKDGNEEMLAALGRLREDSVLGCWCTDSDNAMAEGPLVCHCQVIARCWRYLKTQRSAAKVEPPVNEFQGEFRWLSNFWPAVVTLDGEQYASVEHAYQAAKWPAGTAERTAVLMTKTAADAKRLGKKAPAMDANHKLAWMNNFLRQKFVPGSALARQLLATGNRQLLEGNAWGDTFWGVCKSVGSNWMGRLLMDVRMELQGCPAV